MKKIIAITLTVITIVQLFTFSSFAMDNNPTINEVVEAVIADYSSTTTAAQKKILNKARAASSIEYDEEQEETPKKTSAIVEFFNKVAAFFKSIGDWFRNLFKKPEKPSPEPTPTPIKYYEPYADPDPTGEHIRENNYVSFASYVNTTGEEYAKGKKLPDMLKIAPWVEPEYVNAFTKMTYGSKTIHLGSTEDYMLYTFGKPTETLVYNWYGNKESVQRLHIYADDMNNMIIFTVQEFGMFSSEPSHLARAYRVKDFIEFQEMYYNGDLPVPLQPKNLEIAMRTQTMITGCYTNSESFVFESPGIVRCDYKSVKSTATLNSFDAAIETEEINGLQPIEHFIKRYNASRLSDCLIIDGNNASLKVRGNELTKIEALQAYDIDRNVYTKMPLSIGNDMIVQYYFGKSSEKPCGINICTSTFASLSGIYSVGFVSSRLTDSVSSNIDVKKRLFTYLINSQNIKEGKNLESSYSIETINNFKQTFDQQITR